MLYCVLSLLKFQLAISQKKCTFAVNFEKRSNYIYD